MKINWLLFVGFIVLCNLIGGIGAIWTSSDSAWYKGLNKPSFNPPSWVFGPVWTIIFTLMGISLYFVWTSSDSRIRTIALIFFGVQFLLNILWSYLFFGINNSGLAFLEILILEAFIITTGILFYLVKPISGYLFLPYFLWVGFASVLNYFLWRLN